MNTVTLSLSSNSTSTNIYLPSIKLDGITTLTVNCSAISRAKIPTNLAIRWGDATSDELFTNNFFVDYAEQSLFDQILYGINYTIFKDYSHIYYPSTSTLTKLLSCQILVTYNDSTACRFVQPITILSPSFYSAIGDMFIANTNFTSSDNSLLYTFNTENGYILEMSMDT
jgi:hypothetical protein